MAKITKLTAAQEVELRRTCEEWLAVGRSTRPLDRAAAARVMGDLYARVGVRRPVVLSFSSPAMCVLAYAVLRNTSSLGSQLGGQLRDHLRVQLGGQLWDQLWGQLGGQLWDQLRGQLRDQLRVQLGGQLGDQLRDQLGDQLGGQLGDQLRDQLRDQLGVQLRDQLGDQLGDQLLGQLGGQLLGQLGVQLRDQLWVQLRDQLWGQLWGQLRVQLWNYLAGHHWCDWEAYYDFCRRIGVRYTDAQNADLDLWLEQCRACHWWWPFRGVVLASERHAVVEVDDRGRLHCLTGPAVAYPDGWAVHAVHGVRVPADVIERPESLTAGRIAREANAEVRRVMVERYGPDRYLRDSGARAVQQDDYGTLYRQEMANDEPLVMVRLTNATAEKDGSRKTYWLRVPPTMRTAREAVAWTFGKEGQEYQPARET